MSPTVLGIVNVTPDSFSDGGKYLEPDAALRRAEILLAEGADMVDIGGESTRPGSHPPPEDEELRRVLPVIEAVAEMAPVSIDTRSETVARAAVAAGATVLNDVGANLGPLAAELGVGWIACHMQGTPATMQDQPRYDNVVDEVARFLDDRATVAAEAGVQQLWVDPGFGFGKTTDHNLELLVNLPRLVATGWPVAVGTSRKSTIGKLIAVSDAAPEPAPVDDRLVGSVVTATFALACGADLVRVHDAKAARQAVSVVTGRSPSQSRSR